MSDPTEAAPQTPSETPAAPQPESTADVTAWAKLEAQALETAAADAPADQAPAPETEPAATTPEQTPQEGQPEPEQARTRRQSGEEAYQRGRTDAEREFTERQQSEHNQRQAQEQRDSLIGLAEKTTQGDYEAGVKLAEFVTGAVKGTDQQTREASLYRAGRDAVLKEMASDFEPAVKAIEGIDPADYDTLLKAPSSGQFAKNAIEIGRKLERATLESKLATLEAENTSLKGRLAGTAPSPLGSNGTTGATPRSPIKVGASMRDHARLAAADLGLSVPL